ncbi:MAG: phenylalanine--tRNA ligase subunit beta, partial [Phaeodactylibacter sp.]|nr:phenylalanine--tRNA ligase subunit beta [Phaeodactylibacter sp.]
MICAEDEIGLGTDHDGIIVLPETAQVGMSAAKFYGIEKDVVYEIGLTPNRSDATAHLGVAKDLAAALKVNYGGSGTVKLPEVQDFPENRGTYPVKVTVENTEACPRYAGLVVRNLKIGPSPDWLKQRLQAVGVRPINNVVDITNYVLHEFGQPLHAFDLDQVTGQEIIVKTLPSKTKFQSLDEIERELSDEDLMICNGQSEGMCIGGVFGGLKSGVTDGTTAIFLESAHFNPGWIRRTSMRHNLRTDAAKVFEKGSDPEVVIPALKRAAALMVELAGGEIASGITDIYPNPIEPKQIQVAYEYVQRLIGIAIPEAEIRAILEAMHMDIVQSDPKTFTVAVPTNKFDVLRPADVVEEILRIYGLNKVPIPAQIRTSVNVAPHPSPRKVRDTIGDALNGMGFSEIMAVSLTESRYFRDVLPLDATSLVYINNTSTVQLDVMRPTMLFSGLEAIVHNQNRQQADLRLFEFGRTYLTVEDGHKETQHLSLFLTGKLQSESWLTEAQPDADYYALKGV